MTDRPALALLVRARIVCEDGDFKKARSLVERALDLEPENADAYVVSLMVDHCARREVELGDIPTRTLAQHPDYLKAIRFGDPELRRRLENYDTEAQALAALEQQTGTLRAHQIPLNEPLNAHWKSELNLASHREQERLEKKRRFDLEVAERVARNSALTAKARAILDHSESSMQWEVVEVHPTEPHVFVISRFLIGDMEWTRANQVSWRTSTLREWLNSVFLDAMPKRIRSHIITVDHRDMRDNKPLVDSVFVPALHELRGSTSRTPRYYWESTATGRQTDRPWNASVRRTWWLRDLSSTQGGDRARARAIDSEGKEVFSWGRERRDSIDRDYGATVRSSNGVRPAFWLNVESPKVVQERAVSPLVDLAREHCSNGSFTSNPRSYSMNEPERRLLDRADGCVSLALALNPNDVDAHLVALMAEHGCRSESDLGKLVNDALSNGPSYQSAMRLGDENVRARLATYAEAARTNLRRQGEHATLATRLESVIHDPEESKAAMAESESLSRSVDTLSASREQIAESQARAVDEMRLLDARSESIGRLAWGRRRESSMARKELVIALDLARGQIVTVDREIAGLESRRTGVEARLSRARFVESLRVRQVDDERGRVLVVATLSSWTLPFDKSGTAVAWSDCTLRTWLNNELKAHLPARVRAALQHVDHGNGVVDELFVLTRAEVAERSNVDGAPVLAQGRLGRMWARKPDDELGGEIFQPRGGQWVVAADSTALVVPAMWLSTTRLLETAPASVRL